MRFGGGASGVRGERGPRCVARVLAWAGCLAWKLWDLAQAWGVIRAMMESEGCECNLFCGIDLCVVVDNMGRELRGGTRRAELTNCKRWS